MFAIDGQHADNFVHEPSNVSGIDYNVNAFATQDLRNTHHTLMITANEQVNNSKLILDCLIYMCALLFYYVVEHSSIVMFTVPRKMT